MWLTTIAHRTKAFPKPSKLARRACDLIGFVEVHSNAIDFGLQPFGRNKAREAAATTVPGIPPRARDAPACAHDGFSEKLDRCIVFTNAKEPADVTSVRLARTRWKFDVQVRGLRFHPRRHRLFVPHRLA